MSLLKKAKAVALGATYNPFKPIPVDVFNKGPKMPITPHQARQSQKAASSTDLHVVMGNIDKYLASGPTGRTEWWYSTHNVIKGVDIEEIIRVYRAVGWKVELVADSRDGDALVFTIE